MEDEPNDEKDIRRPLRGLTDSELDALTDDLQYYERDITRLYSVVMQERTYRYAEKLRKPSL